MSNSEPVNKLNIPRMLARSRLNFGSRVLMREHNGQKFIDITYDDFWLMVMQAASALRQAGIKAGDRVAILSENRPAWGATYFASLFIEAIYRIVNIRNLDSVNKDIDASGIFDMLGDEIKGMADKSTFLYAQRFGGEESWGDIDYRITNLIYSGISLRLGFRFKF